MVVAKDVEGPDICADQTMPERAARRSWQQGGPRRAPPISVGGTAQNPPAVDPNRDPGLRQVAREGVPGGSGRERDVDRQPGTQVGVDGLRQPRSLEVLR